MTPINQKYLDEVRRIVTRRLANTGAEAILFGSCARGDTHRASDIDVAVGGTDRLPAALLSGLREELEESWIPYRVEVFDLREAGESLRKSVAAEGVRWTA